MAQDTSLHAGGSRVFGEQKLKCRPINPVFRPTRTSTLRGTVKDADKLFFLGALIELSKRPVPSTTLSIDQGTLAVTGANGWVEVSEFGADQLKDERLGTGCGFSATSNVKRLLIEGAPIQTDDRSTLLVAGDVHASMDSKSLQIDGIGNFIWHNGSRLNPTLWERLSVGWQIPLVTGFLAALGFFGKWLWPRTVDFVRRDQRLILDA